MTGMGKEGCLETVARTRFCQAEKKLVEEDCAKPAVEKSRRRQGERRRGTLRCMQAFQRHESRTMAGRETLRYDSRGIQFELPRKCRGELRELPIHH
jgi:DNA integrity scanning protein DisA with diadenylate cyclase activity